MLKERRERQQKIDLVILEEMIPQDHLLRKVERAVDFSFIYPLCAPLYCRDNGRPAIDPEILFRMLFIGYLYGIKSEPRLEEEINYNMATSGFAAWVSQKKLRMRAPSARTAGGAFGTTTLRKKSSMRSCGSASPGGWWAELSCTQILHISRLRRINIRSS